MSSRDVNLSSILVVLMVLVLLFAALFCASITLLMDF